MSKRRDLTNLQATGGAIIRFMKYASTPSELAMCGHALHRAIDLHEHGKKESHSRKLPEAPKAPDDGVELVGHDWTDGSYGGQHCTKCTVRWCDIRHPRTAVCPGAPKAQDTEHVWDTSEAFARKCQTCGVAWVSANVPGLCPGEPEATDTEHDWNTSALTAHRQCRTCEQFWLKVTNGSTCPGPPIGPKPKTADATPEHEWVVQTVGSPKCSKCAVRQSTIAPRCKA